MRQYTITIATRYENYDMAVRYHLVRFIANVDPSPFEVLVRYSDKNMEYWNTEHFADWTPTKGIGPKRTQAICSAIKQALACVRHDCMK